MGELELENLIPRGCIYYAPDKLKDDVRIRSAMPNLIRCLYIGEGPYPPIGEFGRRTCVESYSKDVVEGIRELIKRGVKLLRIYNGIFIGKLLDAKEEGLLKEPLETIDNYFVKPEYLH